MISISFFSSVVLNKVAHLNQNTVNISWLYNVLKHLTTKIPVLCFKSKTYWTFQEYREYALASLFPLPSQDLIDNFLDSNWIFVPTGSLFCVIKNLRFLQWSMLFHVETMVTRFSATFLNVNQSKAYVFGQNCYWKWSISYWVNYWYTG